jgi:hypothetical protein
MRFFHPRKELLINIEKVLLGALDGLAAAAVKFPGQDYPTLAT